MLVTLLTVGGCGGNETVVRFASPPAAIDRPTLSHWMEVIAGGDIRRYIASEGPAGLASEPANYPRCFAAAKLVAPRSFFNQLRYDRAQVTEMCHQLHRAIKAQALSFLIAAHWLIVESVRRGIGAGAGELHRVLERATGQSDPSGKRLRPYLAQRHWSASDLLYQARLEVLASKLAARGKHATREAIGRFAANVIARDRELVARTHCRPGYVVPGCRGYRGSRAIDRSPESIFAELTGNFRPGP